MISEGPALIESLPGELQIALNGALYPDEELLIAVRGNPREAFAATDRRLLVLQEPSVPGIAPVSVREVPLVTVSSVRAVPRPVGGRLMWETTHPDAPTSIDYPTYDGSKYELVAGRLRQMIGQTKNTPSPGVAGEPGLTLTVSTRPCPKCQALVPTDGCWCPGCGLQISDPCWTCGRPLADEANFCAYCGTPNTEPAVIRCPSCKAVVGMKQAWCTDCGTQARPVCQSCEEVMRREWSFCPACGGEPGWSEAESPAGPRAATERDPGPIVEAPARPRTRSGAEANAAGIRAYEAEQYAEAVRHFLEATEAEPDNAGYFTNLGVAYGELGDDAKAMAAYRRAVEINPKEAAAYLNMGYLYNEQERFSEAREMWEKVVQVAPDSEEAQEARGYLRSLGTV